MSSTRVSVLVAVSLAAGASPRSAAAQQVVASDCNLDFTDVYNKGDAVCVTGDLDYVPPNKIFGEAYLYVIPVGAANPFADVSGGPNYIIGAGGGGSFFDEYVWLPPLKSGQYEFVLDNHPFLLDDGAPFDPNKDLRTGLAFTVSSAPIVWSVDPTQIKLEAVQGLEEALGIRVLTSVLSAIDSISTIVEWSMNFGTGGGLTAGIIGLVCTAKGWECPTSYNSWVINVGNRYLNGIADSLEKKYAAIIADPPDPNFGEVVPLDFAEVAALGFPMAPVAEHPIARGQAAIANLLAIQSMAYLALVPSLEKVQGAQQAGDNLGMLLQAEKVEAYAALALAAGDRLVLEADALAAHLEQAGVLDAGYAKDRFNAALSAFKSGGLSAAERDVVRSFGISDAEFEAASAAMQAWEPLADDLNFGAVLQRTRQSYLEFKPALQDLANQAAQVRMENAENALRPGPALSLAAPAAGTVGQPMLLQATAQHFDPSASLEIAWDLDLDGDFDDATGPQAMLTPATPGWTVVRARVSDGTFVDHAHVSIEATPGGAPPEITAISPADPAPFADVGEVVALHVEVVDADGDPTSVTWTVDGAPAGVGPDLEFMMPDEEAHRIAAVIADDDPYTPDVRIGRVIRASKWAPSAGETTGDPTTGDDDTGDAPTGGDSGSGGDSPTSAGPGPGEETGGATTGGGTESASATAGESEGEGGCGCRSDARGTSWLALLLLAWRRRRRG